MPAQLEVGSAAVLPWVLALAEVSVWASAHVWVLLLGSPVLLVWSAERSLSPPPIPNWT